MSLTSMKVPLTAQFVGATEATFVVKELLAHLPVLAFLTGDDKIRMAQQHLLAHDIGHGDPAQGHARGAGVRANKQLFEGRSLGRRLDPEALADVRPVLVVIGDFQPFAFSSAPGCSAMPEQRSTSASFSFSAAFSMSSGSTSTVSHSRQRRAAMSFSALHCGQF